MRHGWYISYNEVGKNDLDKRRAHGKIIAPVYQSILFSRGFSC